jgi:hypothetical protein
MAAPVIHIIDPDSGAGAHYSSLAAWNAAQQRDLVSADEIAMAKCRCTGGTADTTAADISGWTTDATRYIQIYTDPTEGYRHNGAYQTGNKYRLEVNSGDALTLSEPNTYVIGLQIRRTSTSVGQRAINISGACCDNDRYIIGNIIRGAATVGYMKNDGINFTAYAGSVYVINNLFVDFKNTYGDDGTAIVDNNGAGIARYYYNNSICNCASGADFGLPESIIINNLFSACNNPFWNTNASSSSGYNLVDNLLSGRPSDSNWGSTHKIGTTTGAAANKLIDSGGGLSATPIGSVVEDSAGNVTYVTGIDSDIQLALAHDDFGSGEAYSIYTNLYRYVSFIDSGAGDFHLKYDDTGATGAGQNLYTDAGYAVTTDIDGDARQSSGAFDVGMDRNTDPAPYSPTAIINNFINTNMNGASR